MMTTCFGMSKKQSSMLMDELASTKAELSELKGLHSLQMRAKDRTLQLQGEHMADLTTRLSQLTAQYSAERAALQDVRIRLDGRIQDMERAAVDLGDKVKLLTIENQQYKAECAAHAESLDGAYSSVTRLHHELAARDKKLAQLTAANISLAKRVQQLQVSQHAKPDAEQLRLQYDVAVKSVQRLEAQLSEVQQHKSEEVEALKEDNVSFQIQIKDMHRELQRTQMSLAKVHDQFVDYKDKVEAWAHTSTAGDTASRGTYAAKAPPPTSTFSVHADYTPRDDAVWLSCHAQQQPGPVVSKVPDDYQSVAVVSKGSAAKHKAKRPVAGKVRTSTSSC